MSHDDENSYHELGGTGLPPAYAEAIKNACKVCSATPGEPCTEQNGRPRKRPHGSRMVTRIGWSDEKTER